MFTHQSISNAGTADALALFRNEMLGTSPAGTLRNLFADLRQLQRGQAVYESSQRRTQGVLLKIDETHGQGNWELFRLDHDVFVVVSDGYWKSMQPGLVFGEGLVEFHVRLCGVLELMLPGAATPLIVTGPQLLLLHQPQGADVRERVQPNRRDTCISLYCSMQYLRDLFERNTIIGSRLLDEIQAHASTRLWYRCAPLTPGLLYAAKSLVRCRYVGGVRLLNAEAKSLELLCEVLSADDSSKHQPAVISQTEGSQLDQARFILESRFCPAPRIRDVAREVGMSESKLKRGFKARFGVTVFDFGFECRMRYALELLRCDHLAVGQVAYAAGYSHQTSFTAAFHEFFGFLPREARKEVQ